MSGPTLPVVGRTQTAHAVSTNAHGSLVLQSHQVPHPSAGQYRLRLTAAGLSPVEASGIRGRQFRHHALGQHGVGVIESAGPSTSRPVGQRVFAPLRAPCLACQLCRAGYFPQCRQSVRADLRPGGLSSWAIAAEAVAANGLVSLPDALDDATATLIDPLGRVLRAWANALAVPAETVFTPSAVRPNGAAPSVLVIGLELMGLLHVAVARARFESPAHWGVDDSLTGGGHPPTVSASTIACSAHGPPIIAADRIPHRLTLARRYGATVAVNTETENLPAVVADLTAGLGVDLVVATTGHPATLALGAACVGFGGTLLLFSPPTASDQTHRIPPLPLTDLYLREVRLVTSFSAGPPQHLAACAALCAPVGRLATIAPELVTHRFALADYRTAFETLAESAQALQVVMNL